MLDRNSRNVYIVTGLGGEFGTKVAPAIADECKKAGKITIGIAIMPFSFEGNIKYERALQGANELSRNTDAIFLLNNQSILKNNRELSISEAFKKRDHMLCQIIKSINSSIISTENTDSNILGCLKWLNKTYHTLFVKHTKENHKSPFSGLLGFISFQTSGRLRRQARVKCSNFHSSNGPLPPRTPRYRGGRP